jgi:hypothetical protein
VSRVRLLSNMLSQTGEAHYRSHKDAAVLVTCGPRAKQAEDLERVNAAAEYEWITVLIARRLQDGPALYDKPILAGSLHVECGGRQIKQHRRALFSASASG